MTSPEKRKHKLSNKKKIKLAQADKQRQDQIRKLKRELLYPLLKSFVLWFVLLAVISIPAINEPFKAGIIHFTTVTAYWIGSILFLPVEMSSESNLTVAGFPMKIIFECTAYNFYLFIISLVLFARWPIKDKIKNVLIFLLIVYFLNVLRFYIMGYVGKYNYELFDYMHDFVWTIVFGFAVFGIWIWRNNKVLKNQMNSANE